MEKAEDDYIKRVHILCLPFEIEEADEYFELESFCDRFYFGVYVENDAPIYGQYESYDMNENQQYNNHNEYKYTLKYQFEKPMNGTTQNTAESINESSMFSMSSNGKEFKFGTKCVFMKVHSDHLKEIKQLLHSWQTSNNLFDKQYLFTMKELESMINKAFTQCIDLTNNNPLTKLLGNESNISFGMFENKILSHNNTVNDMTESKDIQKEVNNHELNMEFIDFVISKTNSKSFFNTLQAIFIEDDNDLFGTLLLIYELRSKHMDHIFGIGLTESHQTVLLQILSLLYGFVYECFRTNRMY